VSFGFLDTSADSQDEDILKALRESRGVYATITRAAGSPNFINYVLLNGLTYNDNPQGYDAQLLSGLAMTHYVTGSETKTLKYAAEAGEDVTFLITDISADGLEASAQMNGQTVGTVPRFSTSRTLAVKAPATGEMQLVVKAVSAPPDSMFSVSTNSNIPIKNCTVAVGSPSSGGLSTAAKAGIGVGVTVAVLGLMGTAGFFAYKHFFAGGGGGGGAPAAPTVGDGGLSAQTPLGAEKLATSAHVSSLDPSVAMPHDAGLSSPHATGLQGGIQGPMLHAPGGEMGGLSQMAAPPASGLEGGAQSATPWTPGPDPTVAHGAPPLMNSPGMFMPIVPLMAPPPVSPSPHDQRPSPAHPNGPYSPPNPTGPQYGPSPTGPQYPPNPTGPQYAPSPSGGAYPPNPGNLYYPPGHPASPAPYGQSPHASPPPQHPPYHTPAPYGELPTQSPAPYGELPTSSPGPGGPPAPSPHAGSPPPGTYAYPPPGAVGVGGFVAAQQSQRHHHHPWLQAGTPCSDGGCPYNLPGHVCAPGGRCECTCWDDRCPLNQ